MINKIAQEIKETIELFPDNDQIIFDNKLIQINKDNFNQIVPEDNKNIAFIDGGQAEIISSGNFCLSFIRIYGQVFNNNKKISSKKNEFYLLTKVKNINDELFYQSKVYPLTENIIDENDLLISSNNIAIKNGIERASISKVANIARRFAELALAKTISADFVVLDGILKTSYPNEDKYHSKNFSALAKSSCLFTSSGNNPTILLDKIAPQGEWSYLVAENTFFVKINKNSKHVFRFEGDKETLPYLINNSQDSLFLGYPYGLIYVDKMARISNNEKNQLAMSFLLKKENKKIVRYLNANNAHQILDKLEF